jgi:iron(III) transport system ATP-binding protein
MNAGKIEQGGTPEEIYHQPRSEFVAHFIGGTNIVRGRNLGERGIEFAGVPLRCGAGAADGMGETAVSIRQHDIRLLTAQPREPIENLVPATVARQVFLGGTRDYLVEVAGGTQLRVSAPAEQSIAPGSAVWLHLPPDRCRVLAR